jgi:hypothetical protein
MSRRTFAPAIAIAAALVLAACGGGDGDDSAETSTTTTVVITTTTTDPEAEPAAPFCVTWSTFKEVIADLPSNTLPQLQARTVQITAAATSLAAVAPTELQDRAQTILDGAEQLQAAVEDAASLEDAQAAAAPLTGDAGYVAASEDLEAWVVDNCDEG